LIRLRAQGSPEFLAGREVETAWSIVNKEHPVKNDSRIPAPAHRQDVHREMHRLAAAALGLLLLLIPVVSGALTHALAYFSAGGAH
jgi:hypothetical protein